MGSIRATIDSIVELCTITSPQLLDTTPWIHYHHCNMTFLYASSPISLSYVLCVLIQSDLLLSTLDLI